MKFKSEIFVAPQTRELMTNKVFNSKLDKAEKNRVVFVKVWNNFLIIQMLTTAEESFEFLSF